MKPVAVGPFALRQRSLPILSGAFALLALVLFGLWYAYEAHHAEEEEAAYVRENLAQAQAVLTLELSRLDAIAKDYARRTEVVSLVEKQSLAARPAAAGQIQTSLRLLHADLIALTDPAGGLILGAFYDKGLGRFEPLPEPLAERLNPVDELIRLPQSTGDYRAVMPLPQGVAILVSRPVFTTLGRGTIQGILVLGSLLDPNYVRQLVLAPDLTVALYSLSAPATWPAEVAQAQAQLAAGAADVIRVVSAQTIEGYTLLPGLEGAPGLVLRLQMGRPLAQSSGARVLISALMIALLTALGGGVAVYILDRLILTRLRRLSMALRQFHTAGHEALAVAGAENDEVAVLARQISDLVASLQRAAAESERARAEIQALARFPEESPAPILRLSQAGVVLYANGPGRAMLQALYSTPATAVGQVVPAWTEVVGRVCQTGQRVDAEYAAEGCAYACMFAPAGGTGEVNVYGQEITAARQMAADLQREHDFAVQVMNTMGQGLTVTNARNTFEYVNPAYARMLGFEPEELIGRNPVELTWPDDHARLAEARARRAAGAASTYETRLRRLDGGTVYALITGVPRWRDGEVQGAISVITDLTTQKGMETTLRQRIAIDEVIARLSAELIDIAAEELDPAIMSALGQLGRLMAVDRGFVFGLSPDRQTLVCTHLWQAEGAAPLPPELMRGVPVAGFAWWAAQLNRGEEILVEAAGQLPAAAAAEQAMLAGLGIQAMIAVPLAYRKQVVGFLGFASATGLRLWSDDLIALLRIAGEIITNAGARVRAEAAVRASEAQYRALTAALEGRVLERTAELAAANRALESERALLAQRVAERTADLSALNAELARTARAKDEFLASMSHELRTPLNTVLGMSEVLLDGIQGVLTNDQQDSVRSIQDSGRHLLALINDILDISKIEAGRMDLQTGPASIAGVCEASLRLVREAAQRKGLQLNSEVDPAADVIVADERRLKQMLVNLLSNACKFTPQGGAVGLTVAGDADAEAVHFTVWDTGIGIAPEDQERLFQPFVQLDSSLSRQYSGSGLGLSLVRRMAELHGGGVTLESVPGQGSRFTISLPWRRPLVAVGDDDQAPPPALERREAGRGLAAAGNRPRLLLAEDNDANIRTMTAFLAPHYELVLAHTGRETVRQALEVQPAVILMDIQMPDLDGLAATRQIRQHPELANAPIIALTALAMAGDRERCLAAGADAYLSKPVGRRQLLDVIEQLVAARLAAAAAQP